MKIGWVGFGGIGTQMVVRALAAGHAVTAFARGKGLDEVRAAGASICSDYRQLADGCEILGLCVFTDDQLNQVLLDGGALAAMHPGSVVVIHTTGSPAFARELAAAAPAGVGVLDATFSGGPAEVLRGALTLMIGGEADAVAFARPLLETYADKIFHVGQAGQGQMMKLINNLLFATNLKNAAELLRAAEALGFQASKAAEIIQVSSGGSFAMRSFQREVPIDEILDGSRRYVEKDVAIAMSSAAKLDVDMGAFVETARYFLAR